MRLVLWPAIAGMLALLVGTIARAQAVPETQAPLQLPAAIKRALAQQPELAGFVFELRAQDARVSEAAFGPPTQVEGLVEDAGGTGNRSGLTSAQSTLSLSHVFELGGKREGRVAVAEATRARMQTERAARQLDVAANVARRFVETLHEQERLRIAHDALGLAEQTQAAVDRRVRAALAPAAETARAEVRLSQAKLDVEHAEHEFESSRRFLAAAMGERDVRFGAAIGDLFALTRVAPLEDLLGRIDASPDFLRFADEARVRDAELRLAQIKSRPDVRTQFGVRRYEDDGDVALIAGFTLPLQSTRRAQSGIEIARADRERTAVEREAAFLKVQAQLHAQYRELDHSRLEAGVLRETIVPQLEKALQRTEYAYQRGRYSYLELTDAQRELLEARRRSSDVAAQFHLLRIEIERLTGQSLEANGAMP